MRDEGLVYHTILICAGHGRALGTNYSEIKNGKNQWVRKKAFNSHHMKWESWKKNGKDNLPSVFPLGVTTLKALDVELLLLLFVVLLLLWWFVLLLLFNCEDKSGDICVSLEMPFNLKLIAKLKSNGIFGGGSDISIINKNATKCSQHKR